MFKIHSVLKRDSEQCFFHVDGLTMRHKEMHCLWGYLFADFPIGTSESTWSLNPVEQLNLAKIAFPASRGLSRRPRRERPLLAGKDSGIGKRFPKVKK